ncbi:TPA: TrbI/VirB10 family protein [Pasteurella multocida]
MGLFNTFGNKKKAKDDMSPDASPSKNNLRGGKRANKVPLYIAGFIATLFLGAMAYVALERAENQNKITKTDEAPTTGASQYVNAILKNAPSGVVSAQQNEIPIFTPETNTAEQPPQVTEVPTYIPSQPVPVETSYLPEEKDPYLDEMLRMQRERELNAKLSSSSVEASHNDSSFGSSGDPTRNEMLAQMAAVRRQATEASSSLDPMVAYKEQLQLVESQISGGEGYTSESSALRASSSVRNDLQQFNGNSSRWKIDAPMESTSPFEVRAGSVIPAVMISGINSDLPGQILAQVSQNVFDTASGKNLLIPQGARLVGSYTSDVAYGQERVLVAWQRIIYPDGRAQDIGSMPGSDSSGYAGFNDKVNNHYFRIFSSAILMSGITAGVSISQKSANSSQTESTKDILSQSLGQNMGQVIVQMLQKNINISPTLEIRPGYTFNVVVVKDLNFKSPYRHQY